MNGVVRPARKVSSDDRKSPCSVCELTPSPRPRHPCVEPDRGVLMPEIYVSTDCETDGPIPGPHSMLSVASAAMTADGQILGTFSANLQTLPGAAGDPKTMAWWAENQAAWDETRK